MNCICLLIVEDDAKQIELYRDAIDEFNESNSDIQIKPTFAINHDEGIIELEDPQFDAAIIDLKLSGTADTLEGKDLVEQINKKLRIPIFIYSGSVAQIEMEENVLLKKRLRDDVSIDSILDDINDIYKTGITSLLRQGGRIDKMLTEIFWNHLSSSLFSLGNENSTNTLTRYIFAHLQEYLEMGDNGSFDNLHPAEFYIIPPIKQELITGDILSKKNTGGEKEYYILLTPACDIELRTKGNGSKFRKADNGLLIKLIPWGSIEKFSELTNNSSNTQLGNLKAFVSNNRERYHFLPAYSEIKGFFADFQSQISVPVEVLDDKTVYKRIATVSQPFVKDIIARFSQYYSRQGQPNLIEEIVLKDLLKQNQVAPSNPAA